MASRPVESPSGRRGAPAHEVARGRASVVYDLGDGTVLRRSRDPRADVSGEAAVMAHARAHGVLTPLVLEASGQDLVMERVPGPTMLSDVVAHPERAGSHGRLLAELHHLLDTVPTLVGGSAELRLLHLDLHPGNVLLSDRGPVLVDWTNAASGPRSLDVATTWVILGWMGVTEPDAPPADIRAELLTAFLEDVDRQSAEAAVPSAAAARLADPATSTAERELLAGLLRDSAGAPQPLRRGSGKDPSEAPRSE